MRVTRGVSGVSVLLDQRGRGLRSVLLRAQNFSSSDVALTVRCGTCGSALAQNFVPRSLALSLWVDWDACDPCELEVSVLRWEGDGWDALRALVEEAERE